MKEQMNIKVGSILVFPMLLTGEIQKIRNLGEKCTIETLDLSIGVKEMFTNKKIPLAEVFRIKASEVNYGVFGNQTDYELILDKEANDRMKIGDLVIYCFHTGLVFACLTVRYTRLELMQKICHPGYATGDCIYSLSGNEGQIFLEKQLESWLASIGLKSFYGKESLFLEAFIYNVAVFQKRFKTLDEMHRITYNMHLMAPLEQVDDDVSEEDVDYVYAVKDQELKTFRWGCCISSQTISYCMANESLAFSEEMEAQIQDGLPVVILALYEKYTCLHFGRILSDQEKKRVKKIKILKREMLQFRAYGTVTPAVISRWHNVRRIYEHLLEFLGVPEAIEELSDKLEMLSNAQKEMEDTRTQAVMSGITIFGLISILDSVLSIYEVLSVGSSAEWQLIRLAIGAFLLSMGLFWIFSRDNK